MTDHIIDNIAVTGLCSPQQSGRAVYAMDGQINTLTVVKSDCVSPFGSVHFYRGVGYGDVYPMPEYQAYCTGVTSYPARAPTPTETDD